MSSTRLASTSSAASASASSSAPSSQHLRADDSAYAPAASTGKPAADRPPSLGPIVTSSGLLEDWQRSTSTAGLVDLGEPDELQGGAGAGPGESSSSPSAALHDYGHGQHKRRQRYAPAPLEHGYDPHHSVSSSRTVQPGSATTARFPHRDSSASVNTVGSRSSRDRASAPSGGGSGSGSGQTSPALGIGSGNGVQHGPADASRVRSEQRGAAASASPPLGSASLGYFGDLARGATGAMEATVPAPSSHLNLPHLVPSSGSGASTNASSSASSSRPPSTTTSPAFAAVKLFPPTPIGTPTSAGSTNLPLPSKNKGFVVTSRPSPGSSASSSSNTSPVGHAAGLPPQDTSNMPAWNRPASIAGVLAASYPSSPTEGAQFSTIRPIATSGDDTRRRTFADLPRDQSIYPFAAPPGASAHSQPSLVDATLDLAIPVDEQTYRGASFSEGTAGRPSLLTQQILSSPAVPTVSSSASTAQGSINSRIGGSLRNTPASSPATPRAAASRRLGGAGIFHHSSNSSSGGLVKRSSLLGGWTQHFSGSHPSEHDEENNNSISRRGSKGKERVEMGPPDAEFGTSRRGKLGSRSSTKTGSQSQGHSASASVSGTTSATGSISGRPGSRSRNPSGGSALSGIDGDEGRQEKNDVIETAELLFVRDPTSGRKMINQYLIMQEIGRGQHGTVRLGKDMTHLSPDQSRANTASSSASALVSRQPSATQVPALQNDLPTSPRQIATSPVSAESHSGHGSPEGYQPLSKSVNSSSHSSLAQAVVQTQQLAMSEADLGSSPPSAGDGLRRKGSTDERGSYWAIKIVDRAPKRRLPGVSAMRKAQAQGLSRPSAPVSSTGEKIKREIAILKKCRHPNVVRLREVIDAEVSKKIYLILEYCEGGEVKWKSADGKPDLTIAETRRIFRDVVCGLQYLHHQGIIHRDIKPANLLFGKGDLVKISDFGVSHYSHVHRHHDNAECDSPEEDDPAYMDDHELAKTAGSPAFFAPELCYNGDMTPLGSITPGREKNEFNFTSLNAAVARTRAENSTGSTGGNTLRADTPSGDNRGRSRPPITAAIDIWALGVTLYCLFFGKVPFEAPSEYALFSIIPTQDFEIPPTMGADRQPTGGRRAYKQGKGSGISEEVREALDMLERLLEKDPTKRITLPDVKRHPFTLRGLSDPTAWLVSTDPAMDTYVTVSTDEVAAAVTDTGSFKEKFRKGVRQFTHKLHAIASGAGYKSRSRSSSFLATPNDERPQLSFGDDRAPSQSSSMTLSQVNSPTTRGGPRPAPPRSPRLPINDYETNRSSSPHPPALSRRMSLLGKGHAKLERGQQGGQVISLASPSAALLGLPDASDKLGRSVSDRSTTSSAGYVPFQINERRGMAMLGVPKQSLGSASSNEHLPRPLATSTSAEDLDGMILRNVVGASVSSRSSGGMNLRRRQSSDIDGAGRQRTLSNASSSKGNFSRFTRYISRGLSQKSSSAGSSAPRGGGIHRSDFSPTSDGDMDDESHSGHGSPLRNARLRSVSGDDIGRKSLDTTSSYSGAPSSPIPRGSSSMLPSLPLPDFENASFGLASKESRDKMNAETAADHEETYDLEDGVDTSDDDDYGQQYTRHLEHPEELNRGKWRMNAEGIRGQALEPSPMAPQQGQPTTGLGLTTDLARFSDADEGDEEAGPSAPTRSVLSPLQPLTPANEETNAMEDVTPLAAPQSWIAPKSPTSPTNPSTSFAEQRRRSMSRGSVRGSPLRSSLPDRSRSPFGLDRRWLEESVDDEEDEEEEGLAIDIGKRGRRGSKPMTPMTGRTLDLP